MKTLLIWILMLAVVATVILLTLLARQGNRDNRVLKLYGNVDQRRVELAFIDPERVAEVLVEEGDVAKPGQIVARQETRRLRDQIASLEAQVNVSEAVLARLRNGTRPEEIDKARAAVATAQAELAYAEKRRARYEGLWVRSRSAISENDLDESRTREEVAREQFVQRSKELELAIKGPRREDIDEAEASLRMYQRRLDELRNKLGDAELKSPSLAVVRSRLLEPGDMAAPQKPILSLAVVSPKWVRAYLSEPDLGLVKPGMEAEVFTDSDPMPVRGKVGFISSVAEFTPKTVQTEELRTSLVYEVRVYVDDPDDRLRLGMPATVVFPGVVRAAH